MPTKPVIRDWKAQKSKDPDVGSYEAANASVFQSTIKRPPTCKFSKKENERYTAIVARSK